MMKRLFPDNYSSMFKHIFILLIVFLLLVFLGMIYSFGNSLTTSILITLPQPKVLFAPDYALPIIEDSHVFSKAHYENRTHERKSSEDVIVFLVASFSGDIRLSFDPYPRLLQKIRRLDSALDDNRTTDIIIFHTGYPFRRDIIFIMEATAREVYFVNVDHVFYRFSPGFDPHFTDPWWSQKGKWNYQLMCYFWFKHIFQLKIMRRYRYMMRLDDDSLMKGKWPDVFKIAAKERAIYIANGRELDYEYVLPGMRFVKNLTVDFMNKHKVIPANPAIMSDVFNNTIDIPNFWNNFEVLDLGFMQRKMVVQFIEAVDQSRGIFFHRWGDAPLRYIMLGLFANASEILHRITLGLEYCHPC